METLPLFPLGTVLFPGMVLPLRVFEPRYRLLVQRLLDLPDDAPREFGVVAIRQGSEVGADGVGALFDVGCMARVRLVEPHEDGSYDVVTVGTERFRLDAVDRSEPYLQAAVVRLPDALGAGDEAAVVAAGVRTLYADYLQALADVQQLELSVPELPTEPLELSHLVAATAPLALADRHALLAAPDGLSRLRAEQQLLKRELTMLRRIHAVPIPLADLQLPHSAN
jgi:Lon protease-like protein